MEKIGSIVSRVVDSLGKDAGSSAKDRSQSERITGDIESAWCKVVNDDIRAHSYVESCRQDELIVKVDSSCYLTLLKMKSKEILEKLKAAGWENIKNIRFRM
jgi:predicted nucleic acid-binding Zn ribbon protein